MKKLLISIFALLLLTACGSTKKITEQNKVDSSAVVTTKITEKVDTSVVIKGSNSTASKPADNILKGDSLVLEDAAQRIVITYEPETKNLQATATVKDREVPISIDRTTESTSEVETTHEELKKETETKSYPWELILALVLIILILLLLNKFTR